MQKQDTAREKFEKKSKFEPIFHIFIKRWGWNNHIGWAFLPKLINIGYGIRACWVEKIMKINKHTPTFIRYSRVPSYLEDWLGMGLKANFFI